MVQEAPQEALGNSHVKIHNDSRLWINMLTRRWRCNNPAIHQILEAIDATKDGKNLDVTLIKVKAHRDNSDNNKVDYAARLQARICQNLNASQKK